MKKALLLSILFVFQACIISQAIVLTRAFGNGLDDRNAKTGTLKGQVLSEVGAGQEGVVVTLEGSTLSVITESNGAFKFEALKPGNYAVVFTALNITPIRQNVTIEPGQVTSIKVQVSLKTLTMKPVEITVGKQQTIKGYSTSSRFGESYGTEIYVGKKTSSISLDSLNANLTTNNARQVLAREAGIHIWENDASGAQVNVATRGLSPNRSWEFNVRQNGYDVASDPIGYPEAYYNPPFEALDKIEIVRGAASLQYGSQFGGQLNYRFRKPNTDKAFSFRTVSSVGSYGLLSTHNEVSGTKGAVSYLGFVNQRVGDGWRHNNRNNVLNTYGNVGVQLTSKIKLGVELTYLNYINQQPGGLTDAQFGQDAQQSSRTRNWFNVNWVIPALTLDYDVTPNTKLAIKTFGLAGQRNSVGFTPAITTPDTVNRVTGLFANRTVDRDWYNNYGLEARMLTKYEFLGNRHAISGGVRYFDGSTRRVQGTGNRNADYDLNLTASDYSRDLNFKSRNVAVFVENMFRLTNSTTVTPGIRYENIYNSANGRLSRNFTTGVDQTLAVEPRTRSFFLFGISIEQDLWDGISLYGNATQAYRPFLFSDLTPTSTTDIIDPNLKDANGYNLDLGIRGTYADWLNFDVSYFYLKYNNRIATLPIANGNTITQFRTNINSSTNSGLEAYAEADLTAALGQKQLLGSLSVFGSVSLINAQYNDFITRTATTDGQGQVVVTEKNLGGYKVENAPATIQRYGLNYSKGWFSLNWQISLIDKIYTDAANTEVANAAGTIGILPAYQIQDLGVAVALTSNIALKSGVNNLLDARYATRRAGGYPGPGILPGEARNWYLTFAAKF